MMGKDFVMSIIIMIFSSRNLSIVIINDSLFYDQKSILSSILV